MLTDYLERWNLTPDGDQIVTHSSRLLPVRQRGTPAMLKLPMEAEEKRGSRLMLWWNGDGVARVLAHDGDALLLERATGNRSLAAFTRQGHDDEATRIICAAVATLHAHDARPPRDLVPLTPWFKDLWPAAEKHGGILARSAATARALLADPQGVVVLHGDIHHDNVLDFGPRGWLAIDPKGLIGERGFDYANLFCNPETDMAVTALERFMRRLEIVTEMAGISRGRMLQWILAWAGLSAAWWLSDGINPEIDLRIAAMASGELANRPQGRG